MSISKDDVMFLGQSIEHKIAALDIKATDEAITKALTVLRVELNDFIRNIK